MIARDDGRDLLRWHRLEALWEDARALPAPARRAFLDREVGDDPALRDEIAQLLEGAERAERLLDSLSPIVGRGAGDVLGGLLLAEVMAGLDDRYEVERELGRGGSAAVFLGRDPVHDLPVAIKVLHPEIAAAVGSLRFEREIDLAKRLCHPCILPLLDSGEIRTGTTGRLWYVTPLVPGGSLRHRLVSDGRLPAAAALRIASDIAEALDYAHGLGVLHRDVKPENILLGEARALLADFGIARAVDAADQGRITGTGFTPGTPPYMSPEQAAGAADLGGTSDVFSLACVVHEMIAGSPPERVYVAAAPATMVDPAIGAALRRVLARALDHQPENRFQSGRAFTTAFSAALESHGLESGTAG